MSKKKFDTKSFVRDLINNKGYTMQVVNGIDTLIPPKKGIQRESKSSNKNTKRTYDVYDHVNIKNAAQYHEFKTYLETQFKESVWMEYWFTETRNFRIDFAIPSKMIAIEIDGGIWMRGRSGHSSGTGIKRDQEKTTLLSSLGWKVIRITPDEQYTVYTAKIIADMIK